MMKKKLTNAKISRKGQTARYFDTETENVSLEDLWGSLRFEFTIASKGGGRTQVRLEMGSDDFSMLAQSMVNIDRSRAMLVMAETLCMEVGQQPERDMDTERSGRRSVVNAAEQAYKKAPVGRNHAERLTYDMVQQIVSELDSPGEKKAKSVSSS